MKEGGLPPFGIKIKLQQGHNLAFHCWLKCCTHARIKIIMFQVFCFSFLPQFCWWLGKAGFLPLCNLDVFVIHAVGQRQRTMQCAACCCCQCWLSWPQLFLLLLQLLPILRSIAVVAFVACCPRIWWVIVFARVCHAVGWVADTTATEIGATWFQWQFDQVGLKLLSITTHVSSHHAHKQTQCSHCHQLHLHGNLFWKHHQRKHVAASCCLGCGLRWVRFLLWQWQKSMLMLSLCKDGRTVHWELCIVAARCVLFVGMLWTRTKAVFVLAANIDAPHTVIHQTWAFQTQPSPPLGPWSNHMKTCSMPNFCVLSNEHSSLCCSTIDCSLCTWSVCMYTEINFEFLGFVCVSHILQN